MRVALLLRVDVQLADRVRAGVLLLTLALAVVAIPTVWTTYVFSYNQGSRNFGLWRICETLRAPEIPSGPTVGTSRLDPLLLMPFAAAGADDDHPLPSLSPKPVHDDDNPVPQPPDDDDWRITEPCLSCA
jgi:hypothetical protein